MNRRELIVGTALSAAASAVPLAAAQAVTPVVPDVSTTVIMNSWTLWKLSLEGRTTFVEDREPGTTPWRYMGDPVRVDDRMQDWVVATKREFAMEISVSRVNLEPFWEKRALV